MSTSVTNEQSFEWQIENALIGSTREERGESADVAAQSPAEDRFFWGKPSDMDKTLAIDLRRLWSFLNATQPDKLKAYLETVAATSVTFTPCPAPSYAPS